MRIADNTSYIRFLNDLQRTQQQMLEAQIQVSSGKKVNKPSDDPAAASDIVRLSSEKAQDDQFSANVDAAKATLNVADTSLNTVEQVIDRVRSLALAASSAGSDTNASVPEIDGLRDQLISLANTTQQGRYIFGGSVTTTPPYVKAGNGSVTYNGNSTPTFLQVSQIQTVQSQIPGSDIFSGSVDVFSATSDLLTAMRAGDRSGITSQVAKIEQFAQSVSTARTRIGGYVNVADSVSSQLTATGLARAKELSDVQSANEAEAATQFTLSQTSLQATLAVGARIAQMSLMDYLK